MELLAPSSCTILALVAFSIPKWLINWVTYEQCLKIPIAPYYLPQPFDILCLSWFIFRRKPYWWDWVESHCVFDVHLSDAEEIFVEHFDFFVYVKIIYSIFE